MAVFSKLLQPIIFEKRLLLYPWGLSASPVQAKRGVRPQRDITILHEYEYETFSAHRRLRVYITISGMSPKNRNSPSNVSVSPEVQCAMCMGLSSIRKAMKNGLCSETCCS